MNNPAFTESAAFFGNDRLRFGILSLPDAPLKGMPGIIIPNTGLEHRVGPNRMHVELARALAAAGFQVLRLDIGGLGDSPAGGQTHDDAVNDLRCAMDLMQQRGLAAHFTCIGLCSGAHDVHRVALLDARVTAAVFLDGYSYRTPRFWLHYISDRLRSRKRYGNVFRRIRRKLTRESDDAELHDVRAEDIGYFISPPRPTMEVDLNTFMQRKMPLCYVYTGQVQNEYNYRDQLLDAFPALRRYDKLALRLMVEADHTFTRRATREELTRTILSWLDAYPQNPPNTSR